MDFLLGNPFATPVGQRIEKATDGSLRSEDWALNMEICDIINETEEGPKDAIRAIKKRIVGNKNFQEVTLALTVLEACVKNCGHRFHVLAANQEFVEGVLVRAILPKNNPPAIVHDKILNLIQAWADAFRSAPDLTGVVAVYEDLRRKGLEFPMTDLDTLSPIHTPQPSSVKPELVPRPDLTPPDTLQRGGSVSQPGPPPYLSQAPTGTSSDAPIIPSPEQIAKLRSELEVVNGNVKVMSEMLTELVPQKATQSDLELLQELNRTCRSMQQRVLELIPRVSHEQLTEELLIVNDNLNNVFIRHERFERIFAGQTGRTAENQATSSAIQAPPPSLSAQLATINTSSGSVSGTLKSLEPGKKPDDDFDMFALTRGSSLAEQRKSVKYEDPQAAEGLAVALDTRQQNTGAIPGTQNNFMDDIEKWLSVDAEDEIEGEEGVTSEEFDQFLKERAKAADRIPSLPSPPTDGPRVSSGSGRDKKRKDEDSLFAL
ncbi:target of Myb1 membrane trafficking protein isoform X2 [Rhinoderma darwinii]|uniref:target of Myb1 membrane trafficking protein isoform X2 n=1 Tax=Rhinoderma darwinii TaxID=43563 RepID=UPI003F669045